MTVLRSTTSHLLPAELLEEHIRERPATLRRHATEDEHERVRDVRVEIEKPRDVREIGVCSDQSSLGITPEAITGELACILGR